MNNELICISFERERALNMGVVGYTYVVKVHYKYSLLEMVAAMSSRAAVLRILPMIAYRCTSTPRVYIRYN